LRVDDPAMAEGRRVGDDIVSWQVTKLAKAHRALVGDALAGRQDGLSQSSLVARLGVEPLTERGRELQRPVRDLRREVERRLLTGLSDEDRERLVARLAIVELSDQGRAAPWSAWPRPWRRPPAWSRRAAEPPAAETRLPARPPQGSDGAMMGLNMAVFRVRAREARRARAALPGRRVAGG
jgi:hypothetical protein